MKFAKYASDIQEVLDLTNTDGMENFVRNTVKYIIVENRNKINWLAHELLADVIPNENIIEIFDIE